MAHVLIMSVGSVVAVAAARGQEAACAVAVETCRRLTRAAGGLLPPHVHGLCSECAAGSLATRASTHRRRAAGAVPDGNGWPAEFLAWLAPYAAAPAPVAGDRARPMLGKRRGRLSVPSSGGACASF